jgi:hypothetical protein
MAKQKRKGGIASPGIRVVGLDAALHRGLRLIAVRNGIAVREVYHEAMLDVLAKHGEKSA